MNHSSTSIKRQALRILTQTDTLLGESEVQTIAAAMSLLSEYADGYKLFGVHLENAGLHECVEVLQAFYQANRTETDRKDKGRYYTPMHLARATTRTTIAPVMPDKSKPVIGLRRKLEEVAALPVDQQLREMLRYSVCDPACGAGSFLTIAARQVGVEVARIAFQSKQLTPEQVEFGMLAAAQNCIYGVDLDPLAVELCKLALWLNATPQQLLTHLSLPNLPNIRCGDALVGVNDLSVLKQGIPDGFYKTHGRDDKTIAAELRKRNKQERSRFKLTSKGATLETLKTACNVWTAACFLPKSAGELVPTTYTVQCVLNGEIFPEQQAIVDRANELALELKFFHWRLEFPEVFLPPTSKKQLIVSAA